MLEKLISIENVGTFTHTTTKSSGWDGTFKKNTVICAPNGLGKTTLSLILQSLCGKPELISAKKVFKKGAKTFPEQKIRLRINNNTAEFKNGAWDTTLNNVEVFNVHFVEDNLFSGSLQVSSTKVNLFKYLAGNTGEILKAEISSLRATHRKNLQKIKDMEAEYSNRSKKEKKKMAEEIALAEAEGVLLRADLSDKSRELGLHSQHTFTNFVTRTNEYLAIFGSSMTLGKISTKDRDQKTSFEIKFGTSRVKFDGANAEHIFKYTLSEGDKNALSFSMFLAKFSFVPNPKDWIVVFDDPISSLDSSRRALTATELAKISIKVEQLLVLTHDIGFASLVEQRLKDAPLTLGITSTSKGSQLVARDLHIEMQTPFMQDISRLESFLVSGEQHENGRISLARCLRPSLEGFIRVKYYGKLNKGQWLGDFIGFVRDAPEGDELFHLKNSQTFHNLVSVNDFSKHFHHSDPSLIPTSVDEQELKTYAKMTLKLIKSL